MLEIENLRVDIGGKPVLNGVTTTLADGSFTAVFGHNGAGKTTLLRTLMGLWKPRDGRIVLNGEDITSWSTPRLVQAGIGMVPQLRGTFDSLTVEENLRFAQRSESAIGFDEVYELFPTLQERCKQVVLTMSGGERQMVAVANTLMLGPRILLLDEPSGGLAPHVVGDMFEAFSTVSRRYNLTTVLVEQNVRKAGRLADSVLVLNQGAVSYSGDVATALQQEVWQLL